jgi:hypothetical protein
MNSKFSIDSVINHMEGTSEESWCMDVVKTKDGQNCFYGHLFDMGSNQDEANDLWNWFEAAYATTYMVFPVNDGQHSQYQQPTPKQRILAYLKDLRDGKQKTTHVLMEESYNEYKKLEAQKHVLSIEPNLEGSDTTGAS